MKNKLYTLGFSVSIFLDIIILGLIGYVVHGMFSLGLDEFHSAFQLVMVAYVVWVFSSVKNIYVDCKSKNNDLPMLRAVVYGLTGQLGWLIYNAENYQKVKDGYFEHEEDTAINNVPPMSKLLSSIVVTLVMLFVVFVSYITFLRDRTRGDYMNSLFLAVFLLAVIVYMIFTPKVGEKNRKNPLDKDTGKLASYLVLVFFVAAIAFVFYYAKYLLK